MSSRTVPLLQPQQLSANQLWKLYSHYRMDPYVPFNKADSSELNCSPKSKLRYDRRLVGQTIFVSDTHLGPVTIFFFLESCGFGVMGHPLWREDGYILSCSCWTSPTQSFSDSSPTEFLAMFCSLKCGAPQTWRDRLQYLIPPGIR
jgi:hypothetical protein